MTTSTSEKQFKIVFTAWWLAWAIVHYAVLRDLDLTNSEAFIDSFVNNSMLAGCCWLVSNNMKFYLPGKERYWYILALSLALGIVWIIMVRVVLWMCLKNDGPYLAFLNRSSTIRFGIAFLIIGCMALMSLLWYAQKEQKEIDERKTDAERLAKEAELFKLRQQLQPHFLFNSLNSISALTGSQPEKARHMIQQLSDFLRGTLKKDEQVCITLNEELEYLQLYLDIEKVRFGHRLQTLVDCEAGASEMKLQAMLLQPIVENAIKFGLYDTIGDVVIKITAKNINGELQISVSNPFDPETAQPLAGTGFGLASIQRRLFLLFARHDLLQTTVEDDHFVTTITVPQV
ncbi:sensor histidine kinase [Chitinophagaceae bacterium LWZ2-11]